MAVLRQNPQSNVLMANGWSLLMAVSSALIASAQQLVFGLAFRFSTKTLSIFNMLKKCRCIEKCCMPTSIIFTSLVYFNRLAVFGLWPITKHC